MAWQWTKIVKAEDNYYDVEATEDAIKQDGTYEKIIFRVTPKNSKSENIVEYLKMALQKKVDALNVQNAKDESDNDKLKWVQDNIDISGVK